MKRTGVLLLAVIMLSTFAVGCRVTRDSSVTTEAYVSGLAGTRFDASFWQAGDRFDVSGSLPWTFSGGDVSRLDFRIHSNTVPFSVIASRSTSVGVSKVEKSFTEGVAGTTVYFDKGLRVVELTK